jgi:hypothetical protein
MSLLDRQGFFYALIGLGLLSGAAVFAGGRRDAAIAAAAAVLVMVLYNLLIAPTIIEAVNAISPNVAYQRLPVSTLLTEPTPWVRVARLIAQAVEVLAGGTPFWLPVILLALLALLWLRSGETPGGWSRRVAAATLGLAVLAQLAMFAAMVVRHPPIYESDDHRIWYYPLPFQALLIAVVAVVLGRLPVLANTTRIAAVNLLLAVAIISNVANWNDYRRTHLVSRWFHLVHFQSGALKESLHDGRAVGLLTPDYQRFYEYCLALRGRRL